MEKETQEITIKDKNCKLERYLVVMLYKEYREVYYNILTKEEYTILLNKQTLKEKQDYLLELEKSKNLTHYELGTLFQDINRNKIKIVETYTMYWE